MAWELSEPRRAVLRALVDTFVPSLPRVDDATGFWAIEAVAIANGTQYGLAGGLWSGDPDRAQRVARRMRTGQVEINGGAFTPLAPFGGYEQSGNGRELGRFGLDEFLDVKALQL